VLGEVRSLRLLTDQLNPEDSTGAGQGLGLKAHEQVQELIALIR
jgi:hypothetical protein